MTQKLTFSQDEQQYRNNEGSPSTMPKVFTRALHKRKVWHWCHHLDQASSLMLIHQAVTNRPTHQPFPEQLQSLINKHNVDYFFAFLLSTFCSHTNLGLFHEAILLDGVDTSLNVLPKEDISSGWQKRIYPLVGGWQNQPPTWIKLVLCLQNEREH